MPFILASKLDTHIKNEQGERVAIPLKDTNSILTNIKKYLPKTDSLVFVANHPDSYELTDIHARVFFESLELTGISFKNKIVLDSRNQEKAAEIIKSADLVYLTGGKILIQKIFFDEINLKALLKNYNGLVVGASAGSMNLCEDVCNFPEELSDLDEPRRWVCGLGFCDKIIIPHFDGRTKSYQLKDKEIDVMNDYVLPMSSGKEFLGLPDDSYILIDKNRTQIFGPVYSIKDGKVKNIKNF